MTLRRCAFTLVELVVAVSILSVGIGAVVRSFIGFNEGFNALENQAQAAYFLDSKLSAILSAFAANSSLAVNEDSGSCELNHRSAQWSVRSALVKENEFGKDLEALTVRVSWKESGRPKEMSVTRLIRQQRREEQ